MLRRFIHESNPDDAGIDEGNYGNVTLGKIVILDEIGEISSFQAMYEHAGRKNMMQDLKISKLKVKRRRLKIKDHKA
ncbi:hypothetical protein Tco_0248202 [Tanacetum coccineum]